MSDNSKDTSTQSALEIRIERVNTDKTRKDFGSDTVYHVYFKLSQHPPPEWRNIFGQEWKGMNQKQEVSLDGPFLVLHCQLHEVAAELLPILKNAVALTNEEYTKYAQKETAAREHRQDVWKQERKDVDAMGRSLSFE